MKYFKKQKKLKETEINLQWISVPENKFETNERKLQ